MSDEHPNPALRWKHRRRMAYCALIGALLFPLILTVTTADVVGVVAGAFYIFAGAVVGAYIGFATYDSKWNNKND